MTTTSNITARIYWDDSTDDHGWAFATRIDGQHDDTGPLDVTADASDDELIAALRARLVMDIDDANIEIAR